MSVTFFTVTERQDEMRVDRWFKETYPQLTHGRLEKMFRKGEIRIDKGRVKANTRLEVGQIIRIPPIPEATPRVDEDGNEVAYTPRKPKGLANEDRDFIRSLVIYEDAHLIALNKPFGLAVQGGTNTTRHIDGMLDGLKTTKDQERPRLVHRLDRDTGGLLILGKTRKSTTFLSKAFQGQYVQKEYWALCRGAPRPPTGTINQPIAKRMVKFHDGDKEIMQPAKGEEKGAKRAYTDFQMVDDAGGKMCFMALRPRTGRTHQLRVHTATMGHPIIGDGKYGVKNEEGIGTKVPGLANKMHLFCRAMMFPHPDGRKSFQLDAPLTGHMAYIWDYLSFDKEAKIDWPDL